jgi:phosphoglycolate phosphatase
LPDFALLRGATLAFDLDGTLVDTAPDLIRATNVIMAEAGLSPVSSANTRSLVGRGARALIERAAGLNGHRFTESELTDLVARFIMIYGAGIADESVVFPGVEKALDILIDHGATLCVCTNKPTGLSLQLLEAVGLKHRFAAIIGADATPKPKPDGGHIVHTVIDAGGDPQRAVMIGDSKTDLDAARSAGIPIILMSFGYSEEAPISLMPDALLDSYDVLPAMAARLLARSAH